MEYYVIAYPKIDKKDFEWIQNYRKQYDRQYTLVDPHFTLVFTVTEIDQSELINEVKRLTKGITQINFDIQIATVNAFEEVCHEFLVPDSGYSDIVKLHDKLYSGILGKYLRLDIDFVPHITIGSSEDASQSKARVDSINRNSIKIQGSIDSLDIVSSSDINSKVTSIKRIQLQ